MTTRDKVADVYRIGWGIFFLAAAGFNAVVTLPSSDKVLAAFEELSVFGADAILRAMAPYAAGLIASVVAMEAVVGALILSKGSLARLGIALSIAWIAGLMPFLGWYAIVNLILVATLIPVFRQEFKKSLYDKIVGRLRRRGSGRLIRIEAFGLITSVAIAAVFGGLALIASDDFIPGDSLAKTPFESWDIPGALLIALVALPMLAAATIILHRPESAGLATVSAGWVLVAWIIGQLTVLDYGMALQPAILLIGLGLMGLGLLIHIHLSEAPWRFQRRFIRSSGGKHSV